MFPDLMIGDQLMIETNGKKSPRKIVGFYSITGNVSPPLLYVNYEYINRLINQPGQVYSPRVITSNRDGEFQRRVNDQLQTTFETHGV